MTGDEVAEQIVVGAPHCIVAAMRDRASVNDVAVRTFKVLYN